VDIVNKALLMRTYVAPLQRGLVDAVLRDFSLNEDQERAVRIAGNHILTPGCGQLMMYIGGMGGTGKSRVFQAIQAVIDRADIGSGYLVMAPTGTASNLVNGSTYHSTLGISTLREQTMTGRAKVKQRMKGKGTLLMDEASMLAHYENYNVSRATCLAVGVTDVPYGG
ncbi:hypothetical protein EV122DRAFT_199936, partial [Schizophyllum commune]